MGPVAQAPNVETSVKVSDLHPYQFFSTLLRASLFLQQTAAGEIMLLRLNCKPSGLP